MEYAISTLCIYAYIYIYAVAIRTGYIFQAFSTAIASAVCIPYLGSPAALYINYISAGKINIFMNFLSAARIVVSPVAVEDGAGAETDGWRGEELLPLLLAFMTGGRRHAAQTAMQQQRCGNAHWRQGAPRKKATALARGSPASVLREKLRNGANCELRTENEMLLLKLAKFYVCAGSFYIEIVALDDLRLKIRVAVVPLVPQKKRCLLLCASFYLLLWAFIYFKLLFSLCFSMRYPHICANVPHVAVKWHNNSRE